MHTQGKGREVDLGVQCRCGFPSIGHARDSVTVISSTGISRPFPFPANSHFPPIFVAAIHYMYTIIIGTDRSRERGQRDRERSIPVVMSRSNEGSPCKEETPTPESPVCVTENTHMLTGENRSTALENMFISISGLIGAGKTTLATALAEKMSASVSFLLCVYMRICMCVWGGGVASDGLMWSVFGHRPSGVL